MSINLTICIYFLNPYGHYEVHRTEAELLLGKQEGCRIFISRIIHRLLLFCFDQKMMAKKAYGKERKET